MAIETEVGEAPKVEAARLREFLDDLRTRLASRSHVFLDVHTPTDVHTALLETIQKVLSTLGTQSFVAQRVLSEAAPVVPSAAQATAIVDLLGRVCDQWTASIFARLGPHKTRGLRRLLARPVPDILSLLDLARDENRHSAFLRCLLDPRSAPTVAPAALRALVSRLTDVAELTAELNRALKTDTLSVKREYTIANEWTDEDRRERIDLVISSSRFILAIENKVDSREHGEQTERYWGWLEGATKLRAGIFLSPSGMTPASPRFQAMSYLEMLSCLLEVPAAGGLMAEEEILLASYVRALSASVLDAELRALQQEVSHDGHAQ